MPIPSFTGLQTALRGLTAYQAAIDTTSHNIANANTPGYSRQTVDLTENYPYSVEALSSTNGDGAQLGTGVNIAGIQRIRDQFLDTQYRAQNAVAGGASTTQTILSQAQAALDEPSANGLSGALNNFWQAWSALSNAPSTPAAQQAVIDDGTTVAQTLGQLDSQLQTLEQQVTQQFNQLTGTNGPIASDASQIAQLNTQIAQAKSAGQSANDLMDQRDKLIDDLSQYSSVYVAQNTDGTVNVYFGNSALTTARGGTSSTPALVSGASTDVTDNVTQSNLANASGQLGALLSLNTYNATAGTNSGQLEDYRSSLNDVASQLVSTVNSTIQASNPTAPLFFNPSGTTAATIAVNSSVTTSASAPPYDSATALAVAELQGQGADQTYNQFVTKVGSDVQAAHTAQTTQQALLQTINGQRESVSGVSLDEEMTNLITYQQAYQASAKVMSAMNSMLTTLITDVGRGV